MVKKILFQLLHWLQPDSQHSQEKDNKPLSKSVTVQDALKIALAAKLQSDSERTRQTFEHQAKMFNFFVVSENLYTLPIKEFSKLNAVAYMDHVSRSCTLANITYNNYLTQIKSLFSELIDRAVIETNPFAGIKTKVEKQTVRRPFTSEESILIANHIKEHHQMLFVAIILEHYCLIRPAELRRLKLSCIDFSKSTITISADIAKNNEKRVCTVPRAIWAHLLPFAQLPTNYYLFGLNLEPHPSKQCGEKSLSNAHRRVLKFLQSIGVLQEIDTICLYSWKYLGIKEYAELFGILASKEQAGHKTMDMTLRYYRGNEVNKDILNLDI